MKESLSFSPIKFLILSCAYIKHSLEFFVKINKLHWMEAKPHEMGKKKKKKLIFLLNFWHIYWIFIEIFEYFTNNFDNVKLAQVLWYCAHMIRNMNSKGPKIMELWSKTIQHSKFVKLLSKFSPTQTAQFHFAEVTTSFFSHHAKLCMLDIYMSFFFFRKFLISEIRGFFFKLCKIIWIYTRKKIQIYFPIFWVKIWQNLSTKLICYVSWI